MLDAETLALTEISVALATRSPAAIEAALTRAHQAADPRAVEEVLLQAYLFLGFPATLDGLARWRVRVPGLSELDSQEDPAVWMERGPEILARVYGAQAQPLRDSVRALHPAVERWMVAEGYGKVLGRGGVSLQQREISILAQLAVLGPSPQLYSHLRGALRVGVTPEDIAEALSLAEQISGLDGGPVLGVWSEVLARFGESDVAPARTPSPSTSAC